ncbi:MAG: hypothetical protein WAX14_07855 [Rhodococcus sp. (in: high G+C Gram-positive bacteria)]|uniref:hypothetical protein n=1 Tax=Rhodococcus sp. TaxID=1831 RepID=UPI003BB7BBAC
MALRGSPARVGTLVCATVAAAIVAATAPAAASPSAQPGPRGCVPQIGTNQIVLPLPGIFLPLPSIAGGLPEFDRLPAAPAGLDLPEHIAFRDAHHGSNGYIDVVLRDGSLYTRPHDSTDRWRTVPTPDCLDGQIVAMSVDSNMLVALDSDGWIYSLDNLLSGPMLWNWTRSFGGPIWLWPGVQVPGDPHSPTTWSLSHRISESFVDARGFTHPTTAGLVQVVSLADDGSRIVYQDPWLPADHSYEIGGPVGGRFISVAISTSESVSFVMNRFGDMYVRKYDLDLAGANHIPGRYTWQEQGPLPAAPNQLVERVDPGTAAISLPAEEWRQQPKIPGEITARISVIDTGTRMEDKELRVEGRDGEHTGYWHKSLTSDTWSFTATGAPLAQPVLADANPALDQSTIDLAVRSRVPHRDAHHGRASAAPARPRPRRRSTPARGCPGPAPGEPVGSGQRRTRRVRPDTPRGSRHLRDRNRRHPWATHRRPSGDRHPPARHLDSGVTGRGQSVPRGSIETASATIVPPTRSSAATSNPLLRTANTPT